MKQNINHKKTLFKKVFNSETSKLQGFIVLFYMLIIPFGLISRLVNVEETYYQSKGNIFNTIFAKYGWFWTTVVYGTYLVINQNETPRQKLSSIVRYIIATIYWYMMTQYFFGPSIFDKVFMWSGGNCKISSENEEILTIDNISSSYECKKSKGKWVDGHDISGHCFLLVHSSLFLLEEICGSFNKKKILELNELKLFKRIYFKRIYFVLLFLWIEMLFFTAVYFHSFFENSTGLVSGILCWFLIYFLLLPKLQKHFPLLSPYEIEQENNGKKRSDEAKEQRGRGGGEKESWSVIILDLIINSGILFIERIKMLI